MKKIEKFGVFKLCRILFFDLFININASHTHKFFAFFGLEVACAIAERPYVIDIALVSADVTGVNIRTIIHNIQKEKFHIAGKRTCAIEEPYFILGDGRRKVVYIVHKISLYL